MAPPLRPSFLPGTCPSIREDASASFLKPMSLASVRELSEVQWEQGTGKEPGNVNQEHLLPSVPGPSLSCVAELLPLPRPKNSGM